MTTLREIYNNHSEQGDVGFGDKGNLHSYIEVYEDLLKPYREKDITIMEIGIAHGHSMRMWGEYFTKGKIVGTDIWNGFDKKQFEDPKFTIIIADSGKQELEDRLGDLTFDIIIDDASHKLEDQVFAFRTISHRVKPGGLYIIEDAGLNPESIALFNSLHPNCEIQDRSKVKGLWNDTLVIYRFA